MKQKTAEKKDLINKISSPSITASVLAASIKTRQVFGIPFHVIDLALLIAFFMGSLFSETNGFRVLCGIMTASFAFGYVRDKQLYDKEYKRK